MQDNPQPDDVLSVNTPERVNIEFAVAGIGSRALAYLADISLLVLGVGMSSLLLILLAPLLPIWNRETSKYFVVGLILLQFFLQFGYFALFEAFNNGQTPGKKVCGIRAVMEEGLPITFLASMIRNLLRIVDFLPFGYALGLLWMFFHNQNRRLGDFAAGTLVIRESAVTLDAVQSRLTLISNTETAISPLAARVPLTLDDFNFITDFLSRSETLEAKQSAKLAHEIAKGFMDRGTVTGQELAKVHPGSDRYKRFLRELTKIYLGRGGKAT